MRAEMTSSSSFRLPAICVSYCLAAPSHACCSRRACLPRPVRSVPIGAVSAVRLILVPPYSPSSRVGRRGGGCSLSCLLARRCHHVHGGVGSSAAVCPVAVCSCLPRPAAARLPFRSSYSSRLPAPFARVGRRGAWASRFLVCHAHIVPGWLRSAACFVMGDVLILWISFSRLLGAGAVGYIVYRALSMVRRPFSLVFTAAACFLPIRPGGLSPPHAPVFFPFFGSGGGDFFISPSLSFSIPTRGCLLIDLSRLRLDCDKRVASPVPI